MEAGRPLEGSAIERRYGVTAANEWQRVLSHFVLAEGFALLVLTVPDRDGAELCRNELARLLAEDRKRLIALEPTSPEELVRLASALPEQPADAAIGAVWLSAVVPRSAADHPAWEAAWRRSLAGLNQQRNPLRRRFAWPLLIVGADWVAPTMRDFAPDLWSVRTQVVRIEPDRDRRAELEPRPPAASRDEPRAVGGPSPDPEMALREAARLRGIAGRERALAAMLERAGAGYFGRDELGAAETVLREAADLRSRFDTPIEAGIALHELGRAIRVQGRAAEAEEMFRRALALAEEGGATAVFRGITAHELGRAIRDQDRSAEAEAMFRRALALKEEGDATAVSRGITMNELGRAIRDQGRAAEAEAMFRRALALKEEDGSV